MKLKDDAFQKFKLFKHMVENEARWKIKVLKIDCGGEYLSIEFNKYFEQQGIKHQPTQAHTPQ